MVARAATAPPELLQALAAERRCCVVPRATVIIPNYNNGRASSRDGTRDFLGELLANLEQTLATDPTDLDLVSRALPAQGFTVLSAKLGYKPKNPVSPAGLSAEQLDEVEAFLAALDGNEDVQNVYAGLQG